MRSEIVQKFKAMFEEQKHNLLYSQQIVSEEFALQKDDILDDVDMSCTELEQSMRMRLRNREALFLKKINESLDRIAQGHFGDCEDCGDEIEIKRLEARPTATLCATCKEEHERLENVHIDGRKHKSLGRRLKLA